MSEMREFSTGATRNVDHNRLDFEGFYHPSVMKRFAEYMHKNRHQADGKMRDSDNWQKGIPRDAYMKSGFRHFFEWWEHHRAAGGYIDQPDALEEALCALLFNVQGYLFEHLKNKRQRQAVQAWVEEVLPMPQMPPAYHINAQIK